MLKLIAITILFPLFLFAESVPAPKPDWNFVEKELKANKFKKSFIAEMKKYYEEDDFTEVLELNVLLYLRKSNYHGPQISGDAANEVKDFISKHRKTLDIAEKKYKVPADVIVSLMWLESRLGRNKGTFHVPSVYLHLLQAKQKPVIAYLKTKTGRFADKVTAKQMKDIPERAKRKSKWALGELRAIAKIHEWHWTVGEDFRGSFAGAFGLPQFLPSSYTIWARALEEKAQPQLTKPEDAIMSVAYYLKDHGWKTEVQKKRINALMKYNNSRDYALAILDLAKRTKEIKSVASESKSVPADMVKPDKIRDRLKGDPFKP
jgi:membrane-bound lytic murein transglycosylase B